MKKPGRGKRESVVLWGNGSCFSGWNTEHKVGKNERQDWDGKQGPVHKGLCEPVHGSGLYHGSNETHRKESGRVVCSYPHLRNAPQLQHRDWMG